MTRFFAHNTDPAHPATKTATDLGSPAPCDRDPNAPYLPAGTSTATATEVRPEAKEPPGAIEHAALDHAGPEHTVPPGPPAATQPSGSAQAPHSRRQLALIFSGLIMAVLISSLDQTIVSTALPTIVGDLRGLDHLSWVITAYLLTSTIGLPIYGSSATCWGARVFSCSRSLFSCWDPRCPDRRTAWRSLLPTGLSRESGAAA